MQIKYVLKIWTAEPKCELTATTDFAKHCQEEDCVGLVNTAVQVWQINPPQAAKSRTQNTKYQINAILYKLWQIKETGDKMENQILTSMYTSYQENLSLWQLDILVFVILP